MLAGKRWAVVTQAAEVEPAELERQFAVWLDENVFSAAPAA
jgi:hypothetical protein